ncbi:MAG: glycosyltransferase family 4 protein [bacterium]
MKLAVAQLGSRMHYAVPRILHGAGMLERLYTDICAVKGWPRLLRAVPPPLRPAGLKRLLGRIPHGIPPDRITAFNRFGREYSRRRRAARNPTEATAVNLWAGDRFNELVIQAGLGGVDAVYGFNSASRKLFEAAKDRGLITIVEQTIAPRLLEDRLLAAEFADAPDWGLRERDENTEKFAQREKEEWALADLIVCGSEFVRDGIAEEDGPVDKCVVVPYGVDLLSFPAGDKNGSPGGGPLRVLFVGSVGVRKGIPHLLEAMRLLQSSWVRCRVVGGWGRTDPDVLHRRAPSNVELVGRVPRSEVAREYARADVFCLPSLCEGSATVVYEALAAGLPVVTTPNAGSIVRDGVEGFVVPIRDPEAIADRIRRLADDRELLDDMSRAARERSSYGSVEAYGERLVDALTRLPVR